MIVNGVHYLASISRLSPSSRTNCSVTFDPPLSKGAAGGRARSSISRARHHVMLSASVIATVYDVDALWPHGQLKRCA